MEDSDEPFPTFDPSKPSFERWAVFLVMLVGGLFMCLWPLLTVVQPGNLPAGIAVGFALIFGTPVGLAMFAIAAVVGRGKMRVVPLVALIIFGLAYIQLYLA